MREDVLPAGRPDPELLDQHRGQRGDLHVAEAGEGGDAPLQVASVGRIGPDPGGVAVVGPRDVRGELVHAAAHGRREAVDRGRALGGRLDLGHVHRGQRSGVERAEPLAKHLRRGEGPLHRHLLVEREADQQRHRLFHEEPIGLVVAGEVQAVSHR